jgi:hypothetical protein
MPATAAFAKEAKLKKMKEVVSHYVNKFAGLSFYHKNLFFRVNGHSKSQLFFRHNYFIKISCNHKKLFVAAFLKLKNVAFNFILHITV